MKTESYLYVPITAELHTRAGTNLDGLISQSLWKGVECGELDADLTLTDCPEVRAALTQMNVEFFTEPSPAPDGHVPLGEIKHGVFFPAR
jgi:hypothetical protein